LSPAKINHVSVVDIEQRHLEVIVDDSQLSLAIGKKGQNVRLAAKLLGWRIDIKSEEEKRQEIESQMAAMALRGAPITELKGLGDKTMQRLRDHGIETVEQLAQMTPDELTQIQGIGEKTVDKIRKVVTDYFEADRQATEDQTAAEESAAVAETERLAAVGMADESAPASGEHASAGEKSIDAPAAVEEPSTEEPTVEEPVESPAEEHQESAAAEKKTESEITNATPEEGEASEPATGGKE